MPQGRERIALAGRLAGGVEQAVETGRRRRGHQVDGVLGGRLPVAEGHSRGRGRCVGAHERDRPPISPRSRSSSSSAASLPNRAASTSSVCSPTTGAGSGRLAAQPSNPPSGGGVGPDAGLVDVGHQPARVEQRGRVGDELPHAPVGAPQDLGSVELGGHVLIGPALEPGADEGGQHLPVAVRASSSVRSTPSERSRAAMASPTPDSSTRLRQCRGVRATTITRWPSAVEKSQPKLPNR